MICNDVETTGTNHKNTSKPTDKLTNRQIIYAAAQVAARPIARHRPAIIVIAFLFYTDIAVGLL